MVTGSLFLSESKSIKGKEGCEVKQDVVVHCLGLDEAVPGVTVKVNPPRKLSKVERVALSLHDLFCCTGCAFEYDEDFYDYDSPIVEDSPLVQFPPHAFDFLPNAEALLAEVGGREFLAREVAKILLERRWRGVPDRAVKNLAKTLFGSDIEKAWCLFDVVFDVQPA